MAREARRLADRVRRQGGSCRLLHVAIADEAERAQVVAEMNAARDKEYGEVLERLPEFLAELDNERARGRTTYAEVEECEADLDRYRSWLAKIAARDYFGAPGGAGARAAVAAAAAELATFCVRPSRGPCSPGETLVGYPCPALMPGIGVGGEIEPPARSRRRSGDPYGNDPAGRGSSASRSTVSSTSQRPSGSPGNPAAWLIAFSS